MKSIKKDFEANKNKNTIVPVGVYELLIIKQDMRNHWNTNNI